MTLDPFILLSRFSMICVGTLLFLVTIAGLCGANTLACISVMLTDGIVAVGWIAGSIAIGTLALRRFKLQTNNALFIATAGGLGLGIYSLLGLGFGLLGWLNRPVAVGFPAASIVLFGIGLLRRPSLNGKINRSFINDWLRQPAGFLWLWLIPIVSLTLALVSASILPGLLWKPLDPHPYDVASYHLLVPREWYEGGRIVPLAHNVFSYFPFNVEMQFLLLMHATGGPWAGMYACQFVCVGYAVLMVLAVYGTSLNHNAFSGLIAVAIASTVPWLIMLAGVAYVESALMLYTALCIAWALHALQNKPHFTRALILAGMMAGLACGVKITAMPMLLLAVPVASLVVLLVRRPINVSIKKILLGCFALGIAGAVVLSPWLIRNIIWSGNPIFPLAMKSLGQDHFTDDQVTRFTKAHSPTPSQETLISKFRVLGQDVLLHWQYGYVFFPIALLGFALGWRQRETWLLMICALFVLIVWIGFTHLLPRFLVMLIPIGGLAIGRIHWGRAWPAALVLLLTSAVCGWTFVVPELCKQSNPPLFNGQPRPAFFGTEDLTFMEPQELIDAYAHNPQLNIALVGDAQAFRYQIPMSRLHYRTVFNVASDTDDPVTAWAGAQIKGNPNWFLVINPMEIARLHHTYYGIPKWRNESEAKEQRDFFLRGDQLTEEK